VAASRPFRVMLNFETGSLTPFSDSFVRRLSDMAGAYADQDAVTRQLAAGQDPVIYTGFDAAVPHAADHLPFRTTIISAGSVGGEFFMTKGHHHCRDAAEVYVGMAGEGLMIMQSRDGDVSHTARGYGESERIVGQVVRDHPGDTLYVATKVPPKNRIWPAPSGVDPAETYPGGHIRASLETSLRASGLEAFDVLQFHVWSDE
jgi:oxalate decarboxylase/phosphoglucose isomerase-like protein (cupin superfamily)